MRAAIAARPSVSLSVWTRRLASFLLFAGMAWMARIASTSGFSADALDLRDLVHSSPLPHDMLQPVIVLRDSDCLQYLWFVRSAKLRLSRRAFVPPVVAIIHDSLIPTKATRIAENHFRAEARRVFVRNSRRSAFSPRQSAPALLVVDGRGRLHGAFSIPSSARGMYSVLQAAGSLSLLLH